MANTWRVDLLVVISACLAGFGFLALIADSPGVSVTLIGLAACFGIWARIEQAERHHASTSANPKPRKNDPPSQDSKPPAEQPDVFVIE